jgi:hypothetical protein
MSMRIVVERRSKPDPVTVEVIDSANLRELALEGRAVSPDEAAEALTGAALGRLAGSEHAWLSIEPLRARARTDDPSWDDAFDAMLGYARAQGWMDDTGTMVRAHCEWTS